MYKTIILIAALLSGSMFFSCSESKADYSDNPDMPHFVYLYSQAETSVSIADILDEEKTETTLEVMLRYGVTDDKTATIDAVVEPDFSLVEVYNRTNSETFLPFPSEHLTWTSTQVKINSGSLETSIPFTLKGLDNLENAKFLLPVTIKSVTASNGFAVSEKKKTVYYRISMEDAKSFRLRANKPCVIRALDYDDGGEGVGYYGDVVPQGDYIAYTGGGKWLMYTVRVVDEGDYAVDLDIATGWNGAIAFDVDGKKATETIHLNVEGNWNLFWYYEKYQTPAQPVFHLTKGVHKIKFKEESDGFNIRGFKFTYK